MRRDCWIVSVAAIAISAAALVSGSYEISHERIEANRQERLLQSLHQVLDPADHDNDLTQGRLSVRNLELLGSADPADVFIATREGQPVAALFSSVAPRGYNGPIRLLIGIATDGTVTGVRVTSHSETPGLGDAIEIEESPWIFGFDGVSLASPQTADWSVNRDGGAFDSITGATVTARAIVTSVRNTLLYFQRHRSELFDNPSTIDLSPGDSADE